MTVKVVIVYPNGTRSVAGHAETRGRALTYCYGGGVTPWGRDHASVELWHAQIEGTADALISIGATRRNGGWMLTNHIHNGEAHEIPCVATDEAPGMRRWFIFDIHEAHPRVVEWDDNRYILELQRSVSELVELAKASGHNDRSDVNHAKELIRCRVLQCGLAGACDGKGGRDYPCPLRRTP